MEYQRYLRADHALYSQGVLTPSVIEKNPTHKYLLMEYFPINNASKFYKKEELKNIFPQAIKTLKLLQHPRKRFSGIPIKPFNNTHQKRFEGNRDLYRILRLQNSNRLLSQSTYSKIIEK